MNEFDKFDDEPTWDLIYDDPADPGYRHMQNVEVCDTYKKAYATLEKNGYPITILFNMPMGETYWAQEPDYCTHGAHDIIDALYAYHKAYPDKKLHPNFTFTFDEISHDELIVIRYRLFKFIKEVGCMNRPRLSPDAIFLHYTNSSSDRLN